MGRPTDCPHTPPTHARTHTHTEPQVELSLFIFVLLIFVFIGRVCVEEQEEGEGRVKFGCVYGGVGWCSCEVTVRDRMDGGDGGGGGWGRAAARSKHAEMLPHGRLLRLLERDTRAVLQNE